MSAGAHHSLALTAQSEVCLLVSQRGRVGACVHACVCVSSVMYADELRDDDS